MEAMEEMKGEWVIMKNDEVIEHDLDVKIILELADEKYKDEEVIISKIPSAKFCFY